MPELSRLNAVNITRDANQLTEGDADKEIFTHVGKYIKAKTHLDVAVLKAAFDLSPSDFAYYHVQRLPRGHAKIEKNYLETLSTQAQRISLGFDNGSSNCSPIDSVIYVTKNIVKRDRIYQGKPRPSSPHIKDKHASMIRELIRGELTIPPLFWMNFAAI